MLEALAALAKALLYAGILSGTGAVFTEATLRGSPDTAHFLAGVMRRGALLTIVACLAGALILILRLGGQFDKATLLAVFSSSSGAAISLQLAGAALLLTIAGSDSFARGIRLSHAALVTSSFAFNGHAAAEGLAGLVAFLHVSVASWWVGSLWLLRYACVRLDLADVAQLVRRFSAIATSLIGGLAIAGLVLIRVLVDFANDPWLLPYGQILAVKIGLVLVVLTLAGYNKLRLTPRLIAGDSAAAAALRRMIGAELALIGAILIVTAILTTYAPTTTQQTVIENPSAASFRSISSAP